jgi:hypothetical protein
MISTAFAAVTGRMTFLEAARRGAVAGIWATSVVVGKSAPVASTLTSPPFPVLLPAAPAASKSSLPLRGINLLPMKIETVNSSAIETTFALKDLDCIKELVYCQRQDEILLKTPLAPAQKLETLLCPAPTDDSIFMCAGIYVNKHLKDAPDDSLESEVNRRNMLPPPPSALKHHAPATRSILRANTVEANRGTTRIKKSVSWVKLQGWSASALHSSCNRRGRKALSQQDTTVASLVIIEYLREEKLLKRQSFLSIKSNSKHSRPAWTFSYSSEEDVGKRLASASQGHTERIRSAREKRSQVKGCRWN